MRRRRSSCAAGTIAALSLACLALHAQDPDPQIASVCAAELKTPLPADIASSPVPKTWPRCDSLSLYDSGKWPEARACAISERAGILAKVPERPTDPAFANVSDDQPASGGPVVLAQLYANGEGVPRNPAIAARFWCESLQAGDILVGPVDPDSASQFLATLVAIKSGKLGAPNGDMRLVLCDADGNSGSDGLPPVRHCEDRAEKVHAEEHYSGIESAYTDAEQSYNDGKAAIAKLIPKLTPAQQTAYHRLSAAFDRFIAVNITGRDLNSPPYAGSQGFGPPSDFARQCRFGDFYKAVIDGVHGDVLLGVGETLAEADAKLNSGWRDLLIVESRREDGGADIVAQLRAEERAWLAFRDAFVAFGIAVRGAAEHDKWDEAVTALREGEINTIAQGEAMEIQHSTTEHRSMQADYESQTRDIALDPYLKSWTPAQKAAWQGVRDALDKTVEAHEIGTAAAGASFGAALWKDQQDALLNSVKNGPPKDEGLAAADADLNAAWSATLADQCLFQAIIGFPLKSAATPDRLRNEQRAWLTLRDRWTTLERAAFPSTSGQGFAAQITRKRAATLRARIAACNTQTGPAPEP